MYQCGGEQTVQTSLNAAVEENMESCSFSAEIWTLTFTFMNMHKVDTKKEFQPYLQYFISEY